MSWDTEIRTPWQPGDELPSHNEACMVCGTSSASSPLVERFRALDRSRVGARVRFDDRHQGAPSYAHGGAVAAVLDDAMGYLSFILVRIFVTAHLEVDYRQPVLLGASYDVEAWVQGTEGRKLHLATELRDTDGGAVVAESTGLFVEVDLDHFRP